MDAQVQFLQFEQSWRFQYFFLNIWKYDSVGILDIVGSADNIDIVELMGIIDIVEIIDIANIVDIVDI